MALLAPATTETDLDALAGWYERLPGTLEAAPRKAFEQRATYRKRDAVMLDEIAPDPRGWTTALRVDVDRPDAATAWLDAGLPTPSQIIVHPATGRGHLVWDLRGWVRESDPRAVVFFQRIRDAYTAALGGDRAYAGVFQHSPWSKTYSARMNPHRYELRELALYVDQADLFQPRKRIVRTAAARSEYAALGRNCTAFEGTRTRAYKAVQRFRDAGDYCAFAEYVSAIVANENEQFPAPLSDKEIATIAKSIAKWTWYVYRRSEKAAAERKARYQMTRAAYLEGKRQRVQRAHELRAAGESLSAIAKAIGVSRQSVCNYLREKFDATIHTSQKCAPIRELTGGRDAGQSAQNRLQSAKVVRFLARPRTRTRESIKTPPFADRRPGQSESDVAGNLHDDHPPP